MAGWHKLSVPTVLAAAALLFGCGGGGYYAAATWPPPGVSDCGSAPFLATPLVPFDSIASVTPLGGVGPPGHTMPTDHIYLYMTRAATISAPGASVLGLVVTQRRTGGGQPQVDDYALTLFPCADLWFELGHVARLSASLSAKIGAVDKCNPPYQTGGFTYVQCSKGVEIPLAAGEPIGSASFSLDVKTRDRRVTVTYANPNRLSDPTDDYGDKHVSCPIDYFVSSIADQLRSKLGAPGPVRTAPPVCGQVQFDVPNTASGRWFLPGSPTYPEDPHLALLHHNVQPELAVFSVGNSIPSIPSAAYTFVPASTGRVNLDFPNVTANGEIQCYALTANRRVLLQLLSPTRLRIEGISPGACGDPATWAFSAAAVEFER